MYYSYGIPIYARSGAINWFHLSNVLPLVARDVPLSRFDRLRLAYLGLRIGQYYDNADVISAESKYSLGLIDANQTWKLFLSVNGSNDELGYLANKWSGNKDEIATVLGTQRYKALGDSYRVFEMLRLRNSELKLLIIGSSNFIPKAFRNDRNVIVTGVLNRSEVIDWLRKSRYYISTTYIENSYNAASEGVFFADESYISNIGPHRELLMGMPFEEIAVPRMERTILHVRRADLNGANLKTWADVIADMIGKVSTLS